MPAMVKNKKRTGRYETAIAATIDKIIATNSILLYNIDEKTGFQGTSRCIAIPQESAIHPTNDGNRLHSARSGNVAEKNVLQAEMMRTIDYRIYIL
jgi:hypothetical protein